VSVTILTERLVIDPLTVDDAEALFAYRSLPEVNRYQSWAPAESEDAVRFLCDLALVTFDSPGTWFQLGVRERDTKRLIGDLGLHFLDGGRQVEIGFTFEPAAQGRGLATEAVGAAIGHLFGVMGKHRVVASVDPRNDASIRLLQRLGMRREAHFRQSLWLEGEWVDDAVFAILRSEWESDRQGGHR